MVSTRKPLRLLFGLLTLASLSGCAATAPDLRLATPERISSNTLRHLDRVQTIRGRARFIYESPDGSMSGFARVAIRRPDSVYVKMEAMPGVSVGFFFSNGRAFVLYSPFENTAYYGRVGDVDLSPLFQIKVEYRDLIESLSGVVPVRPGEGWDLSVEDGHIVLRGPAAEGVEEVWVDPKRAVVTKAVLYDTAGEVVAMREFRRFRKRHGVYLPQVIRFFRPRARERMTFYFMKQEANVTLADSDFAFKIPESAAQIRLKREEGIPQSWIR